MRKHSTMREHIDATIEHPMPEEGAGDLLTRRILSGMVARWRFLRQRRASIIIQKIFRGWITRHPLSLHNAAIMIQKIYRGFNIRCFRLCNECDIETKTKMINVAKCRHCNRSISQHCDCRDDCRKSWKPSLDLWGSQRDTVAERLRLRMLRRRCWERERECNISCYTFPLRQVTQTTLVMGCPLHTLINSQKRKIDIEEHPHVHENHAATVIQAATRGFLCRSRTLAQYRRDIGMNIVKLEDIARIFDWNTPLLESILSQGSEGRISILDTAVLKHKERVSDVYKQFLHLASIRRRISRLAIMQKKRLSNLPNAIIMIQRWLRRPRIQERFHERKVSARIIQAAFRFFLKRRELLKIAKMNEEISYHIKEAIGISLLKAQQATIPGAGNASREFANLSHFQRVRTVLTMVRKISRNICVNFETDRIGPSEWHSYFHPLCLEHTSE